MESIHGEFINTRTGQTIFVRDSIMTPEGDTIIMSDHGQLDMATFSKYYIKIDDNSADQVPVPTSAEAPINAPADLVMMAQQDMLAKPTNKVEEFLADLVTDYPPELLDSPSQPSSDLDKTVVENTQEPINESQKMLSKVMSDSNVKLNIYVEFDETTFPKDGINVLKQYFNVTDDDISEWLQNNLLVQYKDQLVDSIIASINSILNGTNNDVVSVERSVTKKTYKWNPKDN